MILQFPPTLLRGGLARLVCGHTQERERKRRITIYNIYVHSIHIYTEIFAEPIFFCVHDIRSYHRRRRVPTHSPREGEIEREPLLDEGLAV